MSSTEWGPPGPGFPEGGEPRNQGWPNWLKMLILLILLLSFGWVVLLSISYFRTGDKLGDLPYMPAPVADLFDASTFQ